MSARANQEPNPKEALIKLILQLPARQVMEVLDFARFINARQNAQTEALSGDLWKGKSVAELAAEQDVPPISQESYQSDFWPQDESVDDFLAAVRQWRQESLAG